MIELNTILTEIEAVLNSCPLIYPYAVAMGDIVLIHDISIISELSKEFPAIWLVERFLIWRYINRSGGLYNIFEAWLLSLPPLPSRQVNMADSCEWIFRLFARHHCKSRIFEKMENFQNDCCRPWTKKPFKNSYSRQLRIVNAVG